MLLMTLCQTKNQTQQFLSSRVLFVSTATGHYLDGQTIFNLKGDTVY